MSSAADVNRAASVTPPVVSKNLWVLAGTASSRSIQIPSSWYGQYLTLHADGDAFYVSFSMHAGATASATGASTASGSPLTFSAVAGTETEKIPNGTKLSVDLACLQTKDQTGEKIFLNVIATGTAGYLRITRSSGVVTPTI